jgi:multidrug efflux pump subunit AcrA (membrane-fusion protein)
MTTTSTRRIVAVELDTTKSTIARTGARVTVQLPSEAFVHGTISSVGRVATAPASSSDSSQGGSGGNGGSSGDATIRVTIRLFGSSGSLDQAPVTVRFEQSRVRDALAVPVTALIAQPGGGFAVEVVSGADRNLVRVTPGVYTSGLVQIEGAGLQPGMRVTTSSL